MGTENGLIPLSEAANILNVSPKMVRTYLQKGTLQGIYVRCRATKKKTHVLIRMMDVLAFKETKLDKFQVSQLRTMCVSMSIRLTRLENTVEQLLAHLGFTDVKLSVDPMDVLQVYARAEAIHVRHIVCDEREQLLWAKRFLAFSTDYLDLVKLITKDKLPWLIYMNLAKILLRNDDMSPTVRMMLNHGLANLRHVVFMYIYRGQGLEQAKAMVPNESLVGRIIQTIYPT